MPAFPVDSASAWACWKAGVIAATNVSPDVALPLYEHRPLSDQRPVLRNLATKAGLNAIRISLDHWPVTAGDDGLHEIDIVAAKGWGDTTHDRKTSFHNWVSPGMRTIRELAEHFDRVLAQCEMLGMGVILVVGSYYSGTNEALWRDRSRHDTLVKFWARTAQRWPQHKALIGFELLNEPQPGFTVMNGQVRGMFYGAMRQRPDPTAPLSDSNYNTNDYPRLMERCVAAIRQHNTTTPVVVSAIHGGHPDGFDIFRFKTAPDLDYATYNTPWPSAWSSLSKPLIQGLNPYYGKDHTDTFSPSDRRYLVKDPMWMVVYTFHMYLPGPYTMQGIDPWAYHGIGMLYPKGDKEGETLVGHETEWRDGLMQVRQADYSKGVQQLIQSCQRAMAFRKDFDVPVFVGEFSAASLDFIRTLPGGMSGRVRDDNTAVRQIVGLSWHKGEATALLKQPLQIGLDNFVDAAGLPYSAHDVVISIDVSGRSNSPYAVQNAPVTLYGARYSPGGTTPFHRNANQVFKFALRADDLAPLGLPTDAPPEVAAQAPAIASFRIIITPELAQRQQTSRVAYVRDVLRMCQHGGFSWGYFADHLTPQRPDFGDEFFRIDPQGKIRALLRRAAFQSYE